MTTELRVSAALASSGLMPLESKLLLGHVLGCDRSWLAAHPEALLDGHQKRLFDALVRRRHNGEPIAYLTGRREFYGLEFEVSQDVLIPRPETELLVDFALEKLPPETTVRALDLGTGSGAVALAIAHARPRARVIAVDVSEAALAVADRNGRRLGISNVQWVVSDWFAGLTQEPFDLIVANPPYIGASDPHLDHGDVRFEPRAALTPGLDGLQAIRRIADEAAAYLVARGWIGIEHGYDQAVAVQAVLRAVDLVSVNTRRDLAGIARTTVAQRA